MNSAVDRLRFPAARKMKHVAGILVTLVAVVTTPVVAQQPAPCQPASEDALIVYGEGLATTSFEFAELKQLGDREVGTVGHDGSPITYRGVPLADLLRSLGVMPSGRLRGAALEQYLVAEARDGYRAVIALAEADSSYRSAAIIVAYEADGEPLDERTGPLQLIVESDRQHGRWVRQLQCIRVARDLGR